MGGFILLEVKSLLVIYSKTETDFEGCGLGILENAYNVKIKEVINGEYILSFSIPVTDEKFALIEPLGFVKAEEQLFKIKKIEESNDGKLIANISCEHISHDLATCKFIPRIQHYGVSPTTILTEALADTPFTLGDVEISTLTDIDLSKVSPTDVIMKVIENVGGEIERDNYTIHLRTKRGNNNGVQFRVGKNIQSIKRETDTSELVTRLYPFGKDDLDISTVNDGKHYIDSPYINNYATPFVAHNEYKDIEDPTELKEKALSEWSTVDFDGIDKPKITYSCNVVELKKLAEYGDIEAFSIGDTVGIIDETLGFDTLQRVMEYEYYPYEPERSSVVLTNVRAENYKSGTLSGILSNIYKTKKGLDKVTNSAGNIVAQYVDNIRAKLQTEIQSIIQNALLHNTADMYVDNIDNPTKALLLGAGVFAIANSKKVNGDWNWRTIANGDRVVADEVAASWVYAGNIIADQISTAIPDSKISSASTWNSAASNAATALNTIEAISSDSKLTPNEKLQVKKEIDIIASEKTLLNSQASTFGVSDTNYNTAYTTLNDYITPLISSMTTTSDITRSTFNNNFKNYYDEKIKLISAIEAKAKSLADAAQSTADSKINEDDAVTIIGNTVNAPYINALKVTAGEVDANWVYAGTIKANQIDVSSGKITANQIDTEGLEADSVNANWVYAGDINANQITSGSISADIIDGGTLSGVQIAVNTNALVGNNLYIGSSTSGTRNLVFKDRSGNEIGLITAGGSNIVFTYGSSDKMYINGEEVHIPNLRAVTTETVALDVTSGAATIEGEFIATQPWVLQNSSFEISPTAPSDLTKIWIDTSGI